MGLTGCAGYPTPYTGLLLRNLSWDLNTENGQEHGNYYFGFRVAVKELILSYHNECIHTYIYSK